MTEQVALGPWMAGGCLFGFVSYLIACLWHRSMPDIKSALMAVLAGGGLIAGPHLLICTFYPNQLVHVLDATTQHHMSHTEVLIRLGDLHTVDVFAGGVAILMVSCAELWSLWKTPRH